MVGMAALAPTTNFFLILSMYLPDYKLGFITKII